MTKRSKYRKRATETDVDMTPMLDIVFIMLIFFIVSATFLDEHGLDLTQPYSDGGESAPAINVYLFEDGSASVNGIKTNLGNILSRVHAIRADSPQASVVLGADMAAPLGNVVFLKDKFDLALIKVRLDIHKQ